MIDGIDVISMIDGAIKEKTVYLYSTYIYK